MPSLKRTEKIAGLIQRKLSFIIQQEVKDPRLPKFITISAVKVSPDLSFAKVFFTALNADKKLVSSILNASAGFLRSALARTSTTRTVPELQFVYDDSLDYATRLSELLRDVKLDDEENN